MKSLFGCSVASLALSFALIGCSGNGTSLTPNDSRLVGTWLSTAISTQNPNGGPVDCQPDGAELPISATEEFGCTANDRITFRADGTVSTNEVPPSVGTWSTNGNQVTVTFSATESATFTYNVNGNTLTMALQDGGATMITTAAKL